MSYLPLSGLSLRDIEYVVAVDDLRNFSRAAERCGVSQAGLSEQVRKLELLLNVTLFERSRRHVAPTPEGTRLILLGREVLASARHLLEVARAHTGPLDSLLHIGVLPTLGPYYIPSLLPKLRQKYAQLALRLSEKTTTNLLQSLRQGELDLALLVPNMLSDSLEYTPLFQEPFVGVFPRGHELAENHNSVSIHDFGRPDLLLLEDGHCLREQALSICPTNFHPQEQRLATSLEMLWHMIGAGEGFSLIPKLALKHRSELDSLTTTRPIAEVEASRTICLVWRASDPRAASFRELAHFLRLTAPEGCIPIEDEHDLKKIKP